MSRRVTWSGNGFADRFASRAKIVTNETLANDGRLVPAALNLPYGKLFFGYTYKPYDPKLDKKKKVVSNEDAEVGCWHSSKLVFG